MPSSRREALGPLPSLFLFLFLCLVLLGGETAHCDEHEQEEEVRKQQEMLFDGTADIIGQHVEHVHPATGWAILRKAGNRAMGGGVPGAIAGLCQVFSLMWLRTIVNYQSRYGVGMREAVSTLYKEGGIVRLYQGWTFAVLQNPASRFGFVAANEAMLSLAESLPGVPMVLLSLVSSFAAGLWRMSISPLDTCKTVLQVDGRVAFASLFVKLRLGEVGHFYQGCFASAAATMLGHYPWFLTYNTLSKRLRVPMHLVGQIMRNAGIGFLASVSSDVVTNSIRVLKTSKQAMASGPVRHSYRAVARAIIDKDGWRGLFTRGLGTRVLTNGVQSMLFTVVWRLLDENRKKRKEEGIAVAATVVTAAAEAAEQQSSGSGSKT